MTVELSENLSEIEQDFINAVKDTDQKKILNIIQKEKFKKYIDKAFGSFKHEETVFRNLKPLALVILYNHNSIVLDELLKLSSKLNVQEFGEMLLFAVLVNHIDALSILHNELNNNELNINDIIDQTDDQRLNLIALAIASKRFKILDQLIKFGANVIKNEYFYTSVNCNNVYAIARLIQEGLKLTPEVRKNALANAIKETNTGKTSWHAAAFLISSDVNYGDKESTRLEAYGISQSKPQYKGIDKFLTLYNDYSKVYLSLYTAPDRSYLLRLPSEIKQHVLDLAVEDFPVAYQAEASLTLKIENNIQLDSYFRRFIRNSFQHVYVYNDTTVEQMVDLIRNKEQELSLLVYRSNVSRAVAYRVCDNYINDCNIESMPTARHLTILGKQIAKIALSIFKKLGSDFTLNRKSREEMANAIGESIFLEETKPIPKRRLAVENTIKKILSEKNNKDRFTELVTTDESQSFAIV